MIRILIVEDNAKVRSGLRAALELDDSIQVSGETGSGLEGIELAGRLHPDIVLMDLEMPGIDGYEATRQIKKQGSAGRVIILSVHSYPAARERAENAGADAFIVKGTGIEEMIAIIQKESAK